MNLREMLSETRRNILRDVSTAVNGRPSDGSLWDDDTLVMYIRDAESKFAAGTLCLRDSNTAATCSISLVEGQAEYPIDRRVITCYAVTYDGSTSLAKTSWASRFGARGDIAQKTARHEQHAVGAPRMYYTDRDSWSLGVYPTPGPQEAGKTLRLQVARRPINPLNQADMGAEPEIPEEYHLDLLEWAVWRALRNHDADLDGDPSNIAIVMARVSAHKKRFDEAIAECKRASKYLNTQHVDYGVDANWS